MIPIQKENRDCLLSIIFPTRNNVDKMISTINNINSLADRNNINYEIIVKIDTDDKESINVLNSLQETQNNLYFLISPRYQGYSSLILALEDMTHLSHGKYVLAIADDATFLTQNWNNILETYLTEFKFYFPFTVWSDNSKGFEYCWAIYPKDIIHILKSLAPHTLVDSWFYEIGNRMKHPAWDENIIEQIKEVQIQITPNPKSPHGSDVYQTHLYHTNSAEFFHSINLIKEHLNYLKWSEIHKHNIINEYKNNLES